MSTRNCRELLEARWAEGKFVCVGLDPDLGKIPEAQLDEVRPMSIVYEFTYRIVNQTRDYVCAYKPNSAFYEVLGSDSWRILRGVIKIIHELAPDVPVILDAKRGDIGNTAEKYAEAAFEWFQADAITLNPYMGISEMAPFLKRIDKMAFILCKTSNKGSTEFQDQMLSAMNYPLYQLIAHNTAKQWNTHNNCALVVGATHPRELKKVRRIVGDAIPLLIPGIGAQGGDVEETVKAGINSKGTGIIINSSRGIIYAKNPREETLKLHNLINEFR